MLNTNPKSDDGLEGRTPAPYGLVSDSIKQDNNLYYSDGKEMVTLAFISCNSFISNI